MAVVSTALNTKKLTFEIERTGVTVPKQIRKRDGSISLFDAKRIATAVDRCLEDVDHSNSVDGAAIATAVTRAVSARSDGSIPDVEDVQDAVELALFASGEFLAARSYIAYREEHKRERDERPIPAEVRAAFDQDLGYFPTPSQQFMFYDKYSRYNYDLQRRETWVETVSRTVDHLRWLVQEYSPGSMQQLEDLSIFERIHTGILNMRVMPSMRLLAMAGPAARRNGLALYNCSYMPVKDIDCFVEALLVSMSGCGVGFSVESDYIEQFPRIKRQKKKQEVETFYIEDSTEGWMAALRHGLQKWWSGEDVTFNYDFLRPAGSPLLIKGGRASGPAPLKEMLDFIRATLFARQGSFLRSTDAHIIMCAVGQAAVSGGVRRTAMISLFDWDDVPMRDIKNGNFNPLLWNANNSAVWPEDISDLDIIEQMTTMIRARSGEPGIFSRANAIRTRPARRKKARFGTNPCGEILLREFGLCNLSIAVARQDDTEESLHDKVELAAIIGTIQSLSTHFPGMREEWKRNAEEERLLGVDLTGQVDCPLLATVSTEGADLRSRLKSHVVEVNKEYAFLVGINQSASVTCDKPSGNSSETLDCGSGIHRRHAKYYIRNFRVSATSPLFKVLRSSKVPMSPENGQSPQTATTWVVHFPKKAPEGALIKSDASAVDQCEFWLLNKEHWTEHNPSCTVTYRDDEVMDLIQWVVQHKDRIGGLSFLPQSDTSYAQLPYQTITEEEYNTAMENFPEVDYAKIYRYELEDMTTAASELACFAGSCDL